MPSLQKYVIFHTLYVHVPIRSNPPLQLLRSAPFHPLILRISAVMPCQTNNLLYYSLFHIDIKTTNFAYKQAKLQTITQNPYYQAKIGTFA